MDQEHQLISYLQITLELILEQVQEVLLLQQWMELLHKYLHREITGNHLRIVQGEITTLYAHCSKINVKEGDIIKQGDKIAEVGSTGKATGPHLHFEIRRDNRYINPDAILAF